MNQDNRSSPRWRRLALAAGLVAVQAACAADGPQEGRSMPAAAPASRVLDVTYLLSVSNEALYEEYRADIVPLCERHGVLIRHDFSVSKIHSAETPQSTNRVFLATFKSAESMKQFFSDPDYQIAKKKLEKSVASFQVVNHP